MLVHDLLYSNGETGLQDFLVILKHSLQNYEKILKTCLFGTTCIVMFISTPSVLVTLYTDLYYFVGFSFALLVRLDINCAVSRDVSA